MDPEADDPEVLRGYRRKANDVITLSAVFNSGMRNNERRLEWLTELRKELRSLCEYFEAAEKHIWRRQCSARRKIREHYDGQPHGKAVLMLLHRQRQKCPMTRYYRLKSRACCGFSRRTTLLSTSTTAHTSPPGPIPMRNDCNDLLSELEGVIQQYTRFLHNSMLSQCNRGTGVLQVAVDNLASVKTVKAFINGGEEAKEDGEWNGCGKDDMDDEESKGTIESSVGELHRRKNYTRARVPCAAPFTISCNDLHDANPAAAFQTVLAFTIPHVFVPADIYDRNVQEDEVT